MAIAGTYKPIGKSKMIKVKNKIPVEIFRCVNEFGNFVLVKKYDNYAGRGKKRKLISSAFESMSEQIYCNMPAEFKLIELFTDSSGNRNIDIKPNPSYQVELIKYYIDKHNCNEYELRNLIMEYLKNNRKKMESDKFKSICNIFDKADKMLSRADTRKNSNKNEADVSYKFLLKSYSRIVELVEEGKKKVGSKDSNVNSNVNSNNDKESIEETQARIRAIWQRIQKDQVLWLDRQQYVRQRLIKFYKVKEG